MTGIPHGTDSRYNNAGCRCTRCRAAHAAYQRDHRTRMRTVPRKQVPHGTLNGYNNYGCKCDACRAANAARGRAYYRARRDAA
jgi:hypothetical protein